MKKFKKLCCILLAVALLCVGLVGCGGQDDQKITNLSIGGAGTSGTFYILGAAYADLLTKQLGINTVCEVTAGSVENVTLMADGQVEMGVVQLDVTLDALNGTGAFTSPVPLKVLAPMYPNVIQIVTLKDSDINTFEDLRGKKVSVGSPGSGMTISRLLEIIERKDRSDRHQRQFRYITQSSVVIIDDMMYARIPDEHLPKLYHALTFLNETRSLIVITNRELSTWSNGAEDTHMVETLVSRLTAGSQIIRLT